MSERNQQKSEQGQITDIFGLNEFIFGGPFSNSNQGLWAQKNPPILRFPGLPNQAHRVQECTVRTGDQHVNFSTGNLWYWQD